ncbi:GumC family protein [Rhodopseudomonas sp. B29]|uniref:GumC family protein n=1 Tax=Rhodopseudomonas sp. B29 TaxID=95607 RepID=UPI0011D26411|nr:GumC family protein [Rhodopseudomonas sp. B29]
MRWGRFFRRNVKQIALLAALLFGLGILALWLIPANYAATALVLVDPREQRVTTDQEVLPGIGQDAAALQSLVEIAKSEGFLQPLIEKLKVADDTEVSGGETNPAKLLEKFRKHLDISRVGLTYVIAMTFTTKDAKRAAYYANAIASAFVANQSNTRTTATDEAADWLSSRLKSLSDKLRTSEDAVAAFRTKYRIIDAGKESTTRQLRVTELTQQVSAARLQTEDARNRYDQAQRDMKADIDGSNGSKSELLTTLRARLNQLNDQIAQRRAVLGDRHPELVISYNQLAELKRQIDAERKRILANAKSDYEAQLDKQKALEQQLKQLEGEMLVDDQAAVKLQELRRDADANRSIYEQFLARYNATNQQRMLQVAQTKIASLATPPARSTRPPLSLLLAALAIFSVALSTVAVASRKSSWVGVDEPDGDLPAKAEPVPPPVAAAPTPAVPPPAAPVAPAPRPSASPSAIAQVLTGAAPVAPVPVAPQSRPQPQQAAAKPAPPPPADMRSSVLRILDAIGVQKTGHGKVVLVTSVEAGSHSGSAVTQALNDVAVERGLLSVIVEVAPDSDPAQAARRAGPSRGRSLQSSAQSIVELISAPSGAAGQGDIREEFDLVLIDASLRDQPDAAQIARYTDYNLVAVDGAAGDSGAVRDAQAKLLKFGRGPIAVVSNRVERRADSPAMQFAS